MKHDPWHEDDWETDEPEHLDRNRRRTIRNAQRRLRKKRREAKREMS